MPDIPKFMNVLNVEARNAIDTRCMELADAYATRANGLIKSASTSTCCAKENALLRKPHRRYLIREQNANVDETTIDTEYETLNVSLVSSLALSALARNAAFYAIAADENAAKNTLNLQFHLNRLKHFSDCNLNSVGLPNQHRTVLEFHTPRILDNVLIGWWGSDGHCGSVMNYAPANEVQKDSCGMSGTSPIEKVDEESESRKKVVDDGDAVDKKTAEPLNVEPTLNPPTNGEVGEQPSSAATFDDTDSANKENESSIANDVRRRKNSIFQAHPSLDRGTEVEPAQPVEKAEAEEPAPEEKRYRRSSSLKIPRQNDANPAQKKIVRFADALGLDLTNVRTFLDELPSVPRSAYSDLNNVETLFPLSTAAPERTLVPMFKQPHTSLNFLDRVRDNYVSLEYAKVCPTPVGSITGNVRVRNLDFCKSVYVRYTVDGWLTFNEFQAVYVPDSCDGFSDKFAFVIYLYDVEVNQRVELAIRFHCAGSQYWDNNNGSNYVFQCLPSAPIAPSYFHSFNPINDSCNSFY